MKNIKSISKSKFDLYRWTYEALPKFLGEEIAWFSDPHEKILATIIHDSCDLDFAAVLLGKDEIGKIRCFDNEANFPSPNEAVQWISEKIDSLHNHSDIFPQNDCELQKKLELFKDVVIEEKQHVNYKILKDKFEWNSARHLIEKIMPYYIDIDGNFIQQFQSTGFNQRLWELFLFNYFIEEHKKIDRTRCSPDFVIYNENFENSAIGIEAVTISSQSKKIDFNSLENNAHNNNLPHNNMAILWSGALYNKLTHTSQEKKGDKKTHYWEKAGLRKKPFVIAIQNFYDESKESIELSILNELLFGYDFTKNPPRKVGSYTKANGTKIPSGFFFNQDNVEHLSAVIATPLGILSKFNRIGKERGFDKQNTIMFNQGICKNDFQIENFVYQVKEHELVHEMWSDGIVVIHNPNALYPLPNNFFPNACHIHFNPETKKLSMHCNRIFPFQSKTTVFTSE